MFVINHRLANIPFDADDFVEVETGAIFIIAKDPFPQISFIKNDDVILYTYEINKPVNSDDYLLRYSATDIKTQLTINSNLMDQPVFFLMLEFMKKAYYA